MVWGAPCLAIINAFIIPSPMRRSSVISVITVALFYWTRHFGAGHFLCVYTGRRSAGTRVMKRLVMGRFSGSYLVDVWAGVCLGGVRGRAWPRRCAVLCLCWPRSAPNSPRAAVFLRHVRELRHALASSQGKTRDVFVNTYKVNRVSSPPHQQQRVLGTRILTYLSPVAEKVTECIKRKAGKRQNSNIITNVLCCPWTVAIHYSKKKKN